MAAQLKDLRLDANDHHALADRWWADIGDRRRDPERNEFRVFAR